MNTKKKVGRVVTSTSRSFIFIARKGEEGDDKWKKGSCRPLGDVVAGREVERGMRHEWHPAAGPDGERGERGEPQSAAPKEDVMRLHG